MPIGLKGYETVSILIICPTTHTTNLGVLHTQLHRNIEHLT